MILFNSFNYFSTASTTFQLFYVNYFPYLFTHIFSTGQTYECLDCRVTIARMHTACKTIYLAITTGP